MHKNLVRVQEKMVENVRENLKTLEISDKRPVIASVLACAEGPLSEEQITARTHIGAGEVRKGIAFFEKKGLVVKTADKKSPVYELSPDMEKAVLRDIGSKMETVRKTTKANAAECESLLESAKVEFDDYDRLMARYLRERICRMKMVSTVISRRNAILRLLDDAAGEDGPIEKVKID